MSRAATSDLRAFLGAFSPEIARIALRVRSFVLEQAPAAHEFVDEAADVVAMSYGLSDRAEDAYCHVVVHSGRVDLEFNDGAAIPDPEGRLEGKGPRMRHVRIESLDDLHRPFVGRFLRSAMSRALPASNTTGKRAATRPAARTTSAKSRTPKKRARKD